MIRHALAPSLCLLLLASPSSAAPVDIEFAPPALPAQQLCLPATPPAALVDKWTAWRDAGAAGLPDELLVEARQLRDLNPSANFPLVEAMLMAGLAAAPPEDRSDYLVDLVNAHIRAGGSLSSSRPASLPNSKPKSGRRRERRSS